jgi:hypothetical protein
LPAVRVAPALGEIPFGPWPEDGSDETITTVIGLIAAIGSVVIGYALAIFIDEAHADANYGGHPASLPFPRP